MRYEVELGFIKSGQRGFGVDTEEERLSVKRVHTRVWV